MSAELMQAVIVLINATSLVMIALLHQAVKK